MSHKHTSSWDAHTICSSYANHIIITTVITTILRVGRGGMAAEREDEIRIYETSIHILCMCVVSSSPTFFPSRWSPSSLSSSCWSSRGQRRLGTRAGRWIPHIRRQIGNLSHSIFNLLQINLRLIFFSRKIRKYHNSKFWKHIAWTKMLTFSWHCGDYSFGLKIDPF